MINLFVSNDRVKCILERVKYLPLISLILYELFPQITCSVNGNIYLFENVINDSIACNTIYENFILMTFLLIFMYISVKKINLNIKFNTNQDILFKILVAIKWPSIIILTITSINTMYHAYGITERALLFDIQMEYLANPLTYPFVHMSIFTSFLDFLIRKRKSSAIITTFLIVLTSLSTQSRSLFITAILLYILLLKRKYLIIGVISIVFVFFSREIIGGNIFNHQIQTAYDIPKVFGEFFNTWGGRRFMFDNFESYPSEQFFLLSLLSITGIKYILAPLIKVLSALGVSFIDHVTIINLNLLDNYGFIGVAGSFISDFIFFPILSPLFIISSILLLWFLFKNEKNPYILTFMILLSIAFIHHLFRWSASNYLTMLCGLFIALKFYVAITKFLFLKKN